MNLEEEIEAKAAEFRAARFLERSGIGIMAIEYTIDDPRLDAGTFLALVARVWPRDYDPARIAGALARTTNVTAWDGQDLVGCLRLLTDGYLFATVPEMLAHPDYRRRGIGRELLRRAVALAPGGRLFLGAQPGNEPFFERVGLERGPTGYVGRRELIERSASRRAASTVPLDPPQGARAGNE